MKVQYLGKTPIAQNIYSFNFSSKIRVQYLPGQYLYYTLPGISENEGRGPSREMTLSSSPTETNIQFTTSIESKSPFKKALFDLVPGTLIEADGPHGVFFLDTSVQNHVFIAGGLGITPFRSMNKFLKDKKLKINRTLIYSTKSREKAIFLDEFKDVHLVDTSKGERISKEIIQRHLKKFTSPHIWIAGPTEFVTTVEKIVHRLKIPPEQIHFEKLTGII
jgi:ferredoxin-NADP reductase